MLGLSFFAPAYGRNSEILAYSKFFEQNGLITSILVLKFT